METTNDAVDAWWFAPPGEQLGYNDGRVAAVGATHTIDGEPVLCDRGLHASIDPFDALQYSASSVLYRVRLSGDVVHGDDKAAATSREYLERHDIKDMLRAFARRCALDVLHLWDAPPCVVDYVHGDDSQRAAAWTAAWYAARDAAWDAARDAAWTAAWTAAWDAARDKYCQWFSDMLSEYITRGKQI